MPNDDLSPMPTPFTEEPELQPGGADALEEDPADLGLGRDLSPEDNPAVDDVLPDEISAPDDKPQAPEGEADDAESGTTASGTSESGGESGGDDSPAAGQEAEDGSPEPPA